MVQNIRLRRNDILLQLPIETEQLTRTQASGLQVATLQSQTYNPVYGTVINVAAGICPAQIGDKAFFQIFTFSTAKDRCYGDEMNPQFANEYIPVSHFAFKEGDYWYMIISASSLYFLFRSTKINHRAYDGGTISEIIPLNNYVVAAPVALSPAGGSAHASGEGGRLLEADYSNKDYQLNQAIVLHPPSGAEAWLNRGDHVFTLRHCDITIEEQYNNPILTALLAPVGGRPDNSQAGGFIIESQNIVAIMVTKVPTVTYKAGYKRIIVRPDEVINETPSGLISVEVDRKTPLTGTVISAGPECATWKEGETVLYARNSGMTIPHPDGDLLVLADIDIFASVTN